MVTNEPFRIKTISQFHELTGLPKPEHPLISVVDYSNIIRPNDKNSINVIFDFYRISIKRGVSKIIYGQQQYDFDEGIMFFMSPNQVLRFEENVEDMEQPSGLMLLIHPDYLWNTPLVKNINQYEFFDYAVNEALFLSEREENLVNSIFHNIQSEYQSNIDRFSKHIIISHLENLLNYADRFYNRQFITRERNSHQILDRLEILLNTTFNSGDLVSEGFPTVKNVASKLNVSSSYLSSLLRVLTGKNTQQHIHLKLIEKAKEKLSTTDLSVSEIAYEFGFEQSQAFSRLFKNKTNQSPLEFRRSFKG